MEVHRSQRLGLTEQRSVRAVTRNGGGEIISPFVIFGRAGGEELTQRA
jgi:hypothetical protein